VLTSLFLLHDLWLKALICLIVSYVIGFFTIKNYIAFADKKNILRQPIRSDGPESHIKNKKNTPTMGGIFIILATLVTTALFIDLSNRYILIVVVIFIIFGAIGLTDDLMKVMYQNSKGFRGSIKLVIQFTAIAAAFIWLGTIDETHTKNHIFLPIENGHYITLGLVFYILFINFVVVGTANAVNLTDGLDGLVSVPSIINLCCLVFLIYAASTPQLATDFHAPHIKSCEELIFFCISLIGAIAAFLTFNLKPAKIFMGDVGSLAIGSALGLIAIIIKQEIIFFIISLLFVAEAISVILQVGSYKIRKKRIFLMAPLHHHFEKKGLSEEIVVKKFWKASALFGAIGMIIFLI
jgi:phospho-N-acetylmuramoyl-pentapeptide-transferase